MEISIVLPAHNEEDNLPRSVSATVQCMESLGWDYEIIIVNDGSSDSTQSIIEKFQSNNFLIKSAHHPVNRGYGAALRSGFAIAQKRWIFFMDSDLQFNIQEISKLAPYIEEDDLVIGYRKNRQDHIIRKINAAIFGFAVNALFGLWLRDIDCAFKLIKKEVIDRAHLESNGALINTELLVRAKKMNYRIKQIPVTHYPRLVGSSSGASIKVILRAVREILLFRLTGHTVSKTPGPPSSKEN